MLLYFLILLLCDLTLVHCDAGGKGNKLKPGKLIRQQFRQLLSCLLASLLQVYAISFSLNLLFHFNMFLVYLIINRYPNLPDIDQIIFFPELLF